MLSRSIVQLLCFSAALALGVPALAGEAKSSETKPLSEDARFVKEAALGGQVGQLYCPMGSNVDYDRYLQ